MNAQERNRLERLSGFVADMLQGNVSELPEHGSIENEELRRHAECLGRVFDELERLRACCRQQEGVDNPALADEDSERFSQRFFVRYGEKEVDRARRSQMPFAVMRIAVDCRQKIISACGAAAAGMLTEALHAICVKKIRRSDVLSSFNPGECAVLLPETSLTEAAAIAGRVRAAMAGQVLTIDGRRFVCGVSIGVAVFTLGDADFAGVLNRAEEAQRAARHRGGDCVVKAEVDTFLKTIIEPDESE